MKITRAGTFVWTAADGPMLHGWTVDMEGAPQPDARDTLALILNHIATVSGLHATAQPDPVAAQGLADDVIERARKAGM